MSLPSRGVWIEIVNLCQFSGTCRRLSRRFTQNEKYIEDEIKNFGALVKVFALVPEHITGKRVHEA